MYSKESTNVVHAYQDFMRNGGVPEGRRRDLPPEQKVDAIININRTIRVKDTFSKQAIQIKIQQNSWELKLSSKDLKHL